MNNIILDNRNNLIIKTPGRKVDEGNINSVVISNHSNSQGENSIAIGLGNSLSEKGAESKGKYSIAIGTNSEAISLHNMGNISIGAPHCTTSYYNSGSGWMVNADNRDQINVSNIQTALPLILNINPIKFRYNYRTTYSDKNSLLDYNVENYQKLTNADKYFHYGFSAQELSTLLKDIYGTEYYGNILDKKTEASIKKIEDCYFINLTNLIPFLVKAIQEQQIQINELKNMLEGK